MISPKSKEGGSFLSKIVSSEAQAAMNAAALKWANRSRDQEDDADTSKLWVELWIQFYENYDDGDFLTLDVFIETINKYNPQKGPFANYFNYVLTRRKKDEEPWLSEPGFSLNTQTPTSLDAPVGEDGQTVLDKRTSGYNTVDPQRLLMTESDELAWTSYISIRLHLLEDNEARQRWYRFLYTEEMTDKYKSRYYYFLDECAVFGVMDLRYLDYYMTRKCRKPMTLAQTPLKPYQEVVPARVGRTDETPVPIPGDVSVSYLHSMGLPGSEAGRSQMKADYDNEKKPILEECD